MAAPVLTISFSTSCSCVAVDFCFFLDKHSAAINPINTVAFVLLSKDELAFFESYAT